MRKAVIFDLDGTLWEVIDTTYKTVNKIAEKYHLKKISRETICSVFGLDKEGVAKRFFPDVNLSDALRYVDESSWLNIQSIIKYGGTIYPNLDVVLSHLKNDYQLFIVSNSCDIQYIEAFFHISGTKQYFRDYIAASQFGLSKGEAIQKIMKDYSIDRGVYVGDTELDLAATKEANVDFIYAKYGFGKGVSAYYSINNITELPNVIETIMKD